MKRILMIILSILTIACFQYGNNDANYSRKIINNLIYCEDIINPAEVDNYDVTVLVKFNYESLDSPFKFISTDEELKEKRNLAKEYYFSHNASILDKLNIEKYNCGISYYAPFVEIIFDGLEEYEKNQENLISKLINSDDVDTASINYIDFSEATINSGESINNYSFSSALTDIGVTNLNYSGDGVRVGTIEPCTPDSTTNLKTDLFTRISSDTSLHSTWVTSIIGGYTGIAQDAHLYCVGSQDYGFSEGINALIDDYNVHVINMSAGVTNSPGYYDYYSAYIDYIVQSTNCTFVKSAGNNGSTTTNITSPGYGMNVITVGSIASDKNVSYFSSWYTSSSFLFKPDMVAPGEKISNIPNLSGSNSGTSFAAPMVTGIVALLMEQFPALKFNPSLVKSALHNGCIELSSQTTYFDEQCGFGLVNYQKSKSYLSNSQYNNFNIPINCVNGDIVASYNVTIPSCKKIEINANWIINSANVGIYTNAYTPVYTKCYLKLYDIQSSSYVKSVSKNSNTCFLEYINPTTANRQYRIDVVVNGSKASGGIEVGSLVYNIEKTHTHDYLYAWKNYTQHRTNCLCGILDIDPHVVSPDAFNNGQQYATCLLCGGLASIGIIYYDGINQSFPATANGSFILPNGVIVLEDEDMDAYLEGTLIFNYPNSDLVNGKMAIPQYLKKRENNLYN